MARFASLMERVSRSLPPPTLKSKASARSADGRLGPEVPECLGRSLFHARILVLEQEGDLVVVRGVAHLAKLAARLDLLLDALGAQSAHPVGGLAGIELQARG